MEGIGKTGKAALMILAITMASKAIGFIRESLIASNFGATASTDAYVIAITIYTSIFLISSEVMGNAFLPIYVRSAQEDSKKADKFAVSLLVIVTVLTTIAVIPGEIFTKYIVRLFAPGFSGEVAGLAVNLTRITFPVIVVTGISIIIGSMLQSKACFFPQAFMGIPNHLLVIAFLLLTGSIYGVTGLAVVTAAGTASQLLVQLPFLKRAGFRLNAGVDIRMPEIRLFFISLFPIFVGSSARQINTMVDRALASNTGYGSITMLNYAGIINISLIGLFITTLTTVIYPKIARSAANDTDHAEVTGESLKVVLTVTLPLFILLWNFRYEIVAVLFQRGNFTAENALRTSRVLLYYSLGIIPAAVTDVLIKAFFSKGLNRIPMYTGVISMGINILLSVLLVYSMGIEGIALATSLAALVAMVLLAVLMHRRNGIITRDLLRYVVSLILSGFVAGIVVFFTKEFLYSLLGTGNIVSMLTCMTLSSGAGVLLYGVLMYRKIWIQR